jgi:agmatinase
MKKLKEKIYEYLCPPGNGVYTVHTAKENKETLHQSLYNTSDVIEVNKKWKASIEKFESNKLPCLLGVTSDTGGGILRGANWGPLFIRTELLKGDAKFFDIGDVRTIPHLLHDKYLNKETIKECQLALYSKESNLPVSALSITEDFCEEFYKQTPNRPLFALGGDHSVSYSLVKPWIQAKKKQGKKVAIIHFDAHTDLMSSRLGIDICFGSWAYHMIELLDDPSLLQQFGIRSSGQPKEHWEKTLGVKQYWAQEFLTKNSIAEDVIDSLKMKNVDELYISFDIDALDSEYASATGTPESGGLAPHHCISLIDQLSNHFKITGADVVEVAPFIRSTHYSGLVPEPETTLQSARLISEKLIEVLS